MTTVATKFDPELARFGSSRSQKRVEDSRLLAGNGLYNDDRNLPGQAWLVIVRSPHAHARIVSIDARAALSAPGVLTVFTAADLAREGIAPVPFVSLFKRPDGSPTATPPRRLLADGTARYVGHAVAAVAAETREQAIDAAERVAVEYEPLPCVIDPKRALEPGAPVVWEKAPDNLAAESRYGNAEAVKEAFAKAAHVTRIELVNQRLIVATIEPRSALAVHAGGRTTLYAPTQVPTAARDGLAAVFGGRKEDFRVVVGDIGGGFGLRGGGICPEDGLVCHAARKLGRPVKWRADRSEEFLSAHMGRDASFAAQLALDRDGKILAMRVHSLANLGAELSTLSALIPLLMTAKVMSTVYRIPAVEYWHRGVLTHTMHTSAYRGAGRPEGVFLMERLIEKAARELGIDPAAMRRKNLLQASDIPYRTHLGETYDSGDFPRILGRVLEAAQWDTFPARRAEAKRRGRLLGRGLAMYMEWTGAVPTETMDIAIDAAGTVTAFTGTMAMGQGIETSYMQLLAEMLQVPLDGIRIVQGDTDLANGQGSVGSRSAFVGGSALALAARTLIEDGKKVAADLLESAPADIEYREGRFRITGTDRSIALGELAGRQPQQTFRVSVTETAGGPSWPNGAMVCEIEIDPETGEPRLVRSTSVDDVGRVINAMIVEGQLHGGFAQGAGQALMEHAAFDAESGQLLTGSFMDYALPRAGDMPPMNALLEEGIPCRTNLLGIKGVGELGTLGSVPAVANAVLDALAEFGVVHLEMPLTQEKVWRAMQRRG